MRDHERGIQPGFTTPMLVDRALYLSAVPVSHQSSGRLVVRALPGTDLPALRPDLTGLARPYLIVSVQDGPELADGAVIALIGGMIALTRGQIALVGRACSESSVAVVVAPVLTAAAAVVALVEQLADRDPLGPLLRGTEDAQPQHDVRSMDGARSRLARDRHEG